MSLARRQLAGTGPLRTRLDVRPPLVGTAAASRGAPDRWCRRMVRARRRRYEPEDGSLAPAVQPARRHGVSTRSCRCCPGRRLGAEGVGSRDYQAWVPTGVEGAGKLRCGSCRYKEDRRSLRGSSDTVSPGDLFPSEERSSFAGSRGCAGCWWPTRCVASAR
jgi:hypothetical protein